eukprot:gene12844-biopygen19984
MQGVHDVVCVRQSAKSNCATSICRVVSRTACWRCCSGRRRTGCRRCAGSPEAWAAAQNAPWGERLKTRPGRVRDASVPANSIVRDASGTRPRPFLPGGSA